MGWSCCPRPGRCCPSGGTVRCSAQLPLRRTIQREIEDNLSEKILFGELKAGQIVMVDGVRHGRVGMAMQAQGRPVTDPDLRGRVTASDLSAVQQPAERQP
jgi:ATP-dependent Clp protease ATP-binding subunit ClpC